MNIIVLFPIDLYEDISYIKNKTVFLVEEELYFNRSSKKLGSMKFNVLKPIYHRASMKAYYDYLKSKKIKVSYIDLNDNWISKIKKIYNEKKDELEFYDPVDRYLLKKISSNFKNSFIVDTPRFILTSDDMKEYKGALRQTSFYGWMRKKYSILMKKDRYIGGKLTYDNENRQQPYKGIEKDISSDTKYTNNRYIKDAFKYIKKTIPDTHLYVWNSKLKDINSLSDTELEIRFPVTISGAKLVLKKFIKDKLDNFGKYQDIILDTEHSLLYHAGISPMLNIGLLTPFNVISEVVRVLKSNNKNLNSVEGFVRQILGWREFCRYTYEHHSSKYLNKNHFNSKSKLKKEWYNGTTKLDPVNLCIEKAFRFGYLHHIERLMIMANSMVLANIHPKEMYRWFTEFSLDSYDWVMEYNIYSMGSYSDGGVFTSKPYISSSNYVIKMSNYTKRNEWVSVWDKMFWLFMKKHRTKIKKIQRLSMLLKHIDKNLK